MIAIAAISFAAFLVVGLIRNDVTQGFVPPEQRVG